MTRGDKRVVLIFQESWGRGGIETFVMNLVRGLCSEEYRIEVWSAYDWDGGHDAELSRFGVERVAVFPGSMPGLVARLKAGLCAWDERLARGDVDVVHVNAMNGMTLAYVEVAKRRGVPVRVAHSHNTDFGDGARALKAAFHHMGRSLWASSATQRLACSRAAGEYLFGDLPFEFLPNGIDVERFAFDRKARQDVRAKLGIPDQALVAGSVGRVSYQKNPLFSVRVLAELVAGGTDARLLLVGDGELTGEVVALAERLGVADLCLHVSSVLDPERYYSAMDVFLMPSVFEGFGYTLLEAQCSGLPCVVSETIQDEVRVTPLVRTVRLDDGSPAWRDNVLEVWAQARDRASWPSQIAEAGFSLVEACEKMESVYGREFDNPDKQRSQKEPMLRGVLRDAKRKARDSRLGCIGVYYVKHRMVEPARWCGTLACAYAHSKVSRLAGEHTNFKGLYAGETCFIVGNGPSLTIGDLEAIAGTGCVCFGANRICDLFEKTTWRPDYMCVMDTGFLTGLESMRDPTEYAQRLQDAGVCHLFASSRLRRYIDPGLAREFITYLEVALSPIFTTMLAPFSDDPFAYVSDLGSVTHFAIQIASYMGFQNIYLVGVDNSYKKYLGEDGKFHSDDSRASHAEGIGQWLDDEADDTVAKSPVEAFRMRGYSDQRKMQLGYMECAKHAKEHGYHIYNATRGGSLEVFERVDLDEVVEKIKSEREGGLG